MTKTNNNGVKIKKIPERMCVACREMKAKNDLFRLVFDGENVSVDITGKKNGRGVYICKDLSCVKKAVKNKGFAKQYGFSLNDDTVKEMEKYLGNE